MQAEVQDGKYILLAILKGFLWVFPHIMHPV